MHRSEVDKFFHWDERMQRFSPQWFRSDMQNVWLYFDHPETDPKAIAAAPGGTPPGIYRLGYSSNQGADNWLGNPLEVRALVFEDSTDGTNAANWTVRLQQVGETRDLCNQPVHVRTMFGTAQFPAVLREPLFILSKDTLNMELQKISGGAVNVRAYMEGCQYFTWSPDLLSFPNARQHMHNLVRKWMNRRRFIYPYWVTTEQPVELAANGNAQAIIRPGEQSQFEAFTVSVVATGNFGLEIREAKTGTSLINGQITQTNALGTAQLPTILPCKYLLPGGHYFTLRFEDLSGAPNSVYITIAGRKIDAPIKSVQEVLEDTRVVPTPADREFQFNLSPY
jgi:hypothetical protein